MAKHRKGQVKAIIVQLFSILTYTLIIHRKPEIIHLSGMQRLTRQSSDYLLQFPHHKTDVSDYCDKLSQFGHIYRCTVCPMYVQT